jgi:hypothetical protein
LIRINHLIEFQIRDLLALEQFLNHHVTACPDDGDDDGNDDYVDNSNNFLAYMLLFSQTTMP